MYMDDYSILGSRRPPLATGEIYHIYNHGIEDRKIFVSDEDYFRFVHDLYEFNDINATVDCAYRFRQAKSVMQDVENPEKKPIVDILVFCMMPNHFHLMLRQRVDGGISKFMQKLGTGYTNYFNTKFKRPGVLFQGKFKAKLVNKESHFLHLPYYIHFNALDLFDNGWRRGALRNPQKAADFLSKYRWSSHLDYVGCRNFPSVTTREFLLEVFGSSEKYRRLFYNFLMNIS